MERTKVGIIGCGNISSIYAQIGQKFANLEVVACSDIDPERAVALAEKFSLPRALKLDEILKDPEIEILINLTVPAAHGSIARAALENGKSVYNEKPLALRRKEARSIMSLAREKGLRLGSAPDTFLGAGLQTCRKLIDSGAIGQPIGATAFMMVRGHESWHPNPEFFYKKGAGPMFDMGPYYITALVSLLGPVVRVTGSARISFEERVIASQPKAGQIIEVEVPTHIAGIMDFASGPVATIVTSFDVAAHRMPHIEIYGSEGTLSVPDPNTFGGPVQICRHKERVWEDVPLAFPYETNSRGLGVADMASAIKSNRSHRASDTLAYHVLDIMHSIIDASASGQHESIAGTCDRPNPLPDRLQPGQID